MWGWWGGGVREVPQVVHTFWFWYGNVELSSAIIISGPCQKMASHLETGMLVQVLGAYNRPLSLLRCAASSTDIRVPCLTPELLEQK